MDGDLGNMSHGAMQNNIYDMSVPAFVRGLTNLHVFIVKAEKFAKSHKFDVVNLLNARLAPDMYNFIQQVQYAYFMALEATGALSGKKQPLFSYNEKSTEDLKKSIQRVLTHLRSLKPADFEGAEKKQIETFLEPKRHMGAYDYIRFAALPNFYFHVTTAYDILRHAGVPLHKDDYLGVLKTSAIRKKKAKA